MHRNGKNAVDCGAKFTFHRFAPPDSANLPEEPREEQRNLWNISYKQECNNTGNNIRNNRLYNLLNLDARHSAGNIEVTANRRSNHSDCNIHNKDDAEYDWIVAKRQRNRQEDRHKDVHDGVAVNEAPRNQNNDIYNYQEDNGMAA